jgi:hypothetical protein
VSDEDIEMYENFYLFGFKPNEKKNFENFMKEQEKIKMSVHNQFVNSFLPPLVIND